MRLYLSSFSWGAVTLALLALLVLANGASAGEAFCEACQGGGGWDPMAKLDEIGNPDAGEKETVMPGLNTAQKNRVGDLESSPSPALRDPMHQLRRALKMAMPARARL